MDQTFETAGGQLKTSSISEWGQEQYHSHSQYGLGSANTISYDAETDSFLLKVTQGLVKLDETFTPADIDSTYPSTKVVAYRHSTSASLYLGKPGAEGVGLSYVTYGWWVNPYEFTQGYVVFGVRTPGNAIPNSGSASFTGTATGVSAENSTKYGVSGQLELTADFGAGTVSGDFKNMTKTNSSGTSPWHDLTLNANINGNTFAGTVQAKDVPALNGPAGGGFFGPGAAEIGGSWSLDNDLAHAVGVFVGKRP